MKSNIQSIVDMIIYEASFRSCQDESASIHSVMLEVENIIIDVMKEIRNQEHRGISCGY